MKNNARHFVFSGLLLTLLSAAGCSPNQGSSSTHNGAVSSVAPNSTLVTTTESASCGVAPSGTLTVVRLDAANNPSSEPGLYEGPVWVDGALYFSDFTFQQGYPSTLRKLSVNDGLTTAINDAGTNGVAIDQNGNIIAASHKFKGIVRYSVATGTHEVVANSYEGNPFNSPNDLAVSRDGTIYFSDPDFQKSAAPGEQPVTGVYKIDVKGNVTLIDGTLYNPNGVSLSPDESTLYVAGGGENGVLRAYHITNEHVGEGKDIASLTVPDGMAIDCLGNIYATEHNSRKLRVFSPSGEQIAEARTDANLTNAAFGGSDGKTLFLTGAGSVWSIELDVTGSAY